MTDRIQEHVATDEIDEPIGGRGKWIVGLPMILLGLGGVVAGVHYDKTVLIIGGIVLVMVFACILAGVLSLELEGGKDGFKLRLGLPQRRIRRRTRIRQEGFPKGEDEGGKPPRK